MLFSENWNCVQYYSEVSKKRLLNANRWSVAFHGAVVPVPGKKSIEGKIFVSHCTYSCCLLVIVLVSNIGLFMGLINIQNIFFWDDIYMFAL